jgi:hypothetical protein
MRRSWGPVALCVLALVAALLWWRARPPEVRARAPGPGGDAGGLPIATAEAEHFDAAALSAAIAAAHADGAQAFIVVRHGHLVSESYGRGLGRDSELDTGFAAVLPALALGIASDAGRLAFGDMTVFDANQAAAAIAANTHVPYERFLSQRLWSRLNAAPAWIARAADGSVPADCCLYARIGDWLRVGSLIDEAGRFEGTQVVPVGWIARMLAPSGPARQSGFGVLLPGAVRGGQGFVSQDVVFVRGLGRWRLWMSPSLKLAVLFGADAAPAWDETHLPNLVIRAVTDRRLVPAH